MSTNVNIYLDGEDVPRVEHGLLILDETTRVNLPLAQDERARWCREAALLLIAEAERAQERYAQQRRDLDAIQADVAEIRAARDAGGAA